MKKTLKVLLKVISIVLVIVLVLGAATVGYCAFAQEADLKITVDKEKTYETFNGFGASAAWWAKVAGGSAKADEVARLLYSEEGLELNIYRYNIGAGSADNPKDSFEDWRRTESFYVFNENTGEYEYDFTRDANAQKMLDLCLSYGCIDTVVLFANSPHYSMTVNGKTCGNENMNVCNLAEENYEAYVDYFLTITEYFIEKGIPVKYISPINEPNWSWGVETVNTSQEGCYYGTEEIYEVFKVFAREIKERNLPVLLSGPESGEIGEQTYEWFEYLYNDPEIRPYLGSLAYHSYWSDNSQFRKMNFGNWTDKNVPDINIDMSEWCELPCASANDSVDAALIQARVMVNDLEFANVNSWSAWVGVHGRGGYEGKEGFFTDGLLAADGNITEVEVITRYYGVAHFSKFIPAGSVRLDTSKNVFDFAPRKDENTGNIRFLFGTNVVSYLTPDGKIVTVVVNEGEERKIDFDVDAEMMTVYTTTQNEQLKETYSGEVAEIELPEKSIMTIVFE